MMVRNVRFALALAAAALVGAACADGPTAAPDRTELARSRPRAIVAGTCTTIGTLLDQAAVIFGAGSPDYNSVRGKLENLGKHVTDGNAPAAKERAFDIVDFVLDKSGEGGLPGTEEQIAEFTSGVYCFAGLDIVVSDPSNSHLIYPSDLEQVVVSEDGQAGIRFPAFPVFAPTLVTFIPETNAPLNTKLDQYPGFFSITAQADAETILTQPVIVGVCAQGVIPTEVRDRLRLGHGLRETPEAATYEGFEITPAAEADFLTCENLSEEVAEASLGSRLWSRVAQLVLPKAAHASNAVFFGGGIGGTVTEFSPFAPVDPELSFGGGIGGTVTEFSRMPSLVLGDLTTLNGSCETIEAPYGSPVQNCLPYVRVRTRLGTIFTEVPVTWAVTAGGGLIAPKVAGVCGALSAAFSDATDPNGVSDICWTLGAEGLNQVRATPELGGDADIPGVYFSPAFQAFDATANPASRLAFVQQPGNVVAGAPLAVAVEARDRNDQRVMGYDGTITVGIASGPAGAVIGGTNPVNAVEGVATFALSLTTAGSYALNASAPFLPGPADLPTSASFSVSPDAPAGMSIVQGNNQVVAAGNPVPVAPTVFVSDQYGNAISGLGVEWTPALSNTATVTQPLTVTGANGQTSTGWTLGDGANQLRAELVSNPAIFVVFDATGTSTLVELNVCAPGGAKDPVNDPSKPFAFYIPDPGPGKTIRQVSVYLSSQGRANQPTEYEVELTTQRATFDPAVSAPVPTRARVNLRGNNSEDKLATFTLSQPIVGASGTSRRDVMVRLRVVDNPDNATLTFNAGQCSPGSKNCKVPPTCAVTEVSSPLPYPTGTFYRKSVGLLVKGTN